MKQNIKTAKQLIKLAKELIADGETKIEELKIDLPTQQLDQAGDEAANALEELNNVGEEIQEDVEDAFEEIQDQLDEQEESAKRIMKACKTASSKDSFQKRYAMQKEKNEEMLKTAMDIHNNLKIAAQKFVNAVEAYHDVKVYAKKLKKAKINKVAWGGSFLKGLFKKHPDVEESLTNKEENAQANLKDITREVKKKVVKCYRGFVESFNNACTQINNLVQSTITNIQQAITTAIGYATKALNDFKNGAIQIGTLFYNIGKRSAIFVGKITLGALFVAIGGVVLAVITAAKGLGFVGRVLGDAFVSAITTIVEKLTSARNAFKSAIESFGEFSTQCKKDVENKIAEGKEWADKQIDDIENKIETKIDEIVEIYNKYDEEALKLGKQIQEIVKTPYYVIKGSIKGIIEGITEQVDE